MADEAAAAAVLGGLGLPGDSAVFLALGRQRVAAFAEVPGLRFVLRTVDPIRPPWPGCRQTTSRPAWTTRNFAATCWACSPSA